MTDQLDTRRKIVALVRRYAGLHLREIARQLETSVALVEYHVPFLEEAGLIHIENDERYQRLYPQGDLHPKPSKADRRRLAVLRGHHALQIVLRLLDVEGALRHKDLAEQMALSKSTLSFHLAKLLDAQLIDKHDDGFRLRDRAALTRLLVDHEPTPDLQQRFADLWLRFYDA